MVSIIVMAIATSCQLASVQARDRDVVIELFNPAEEMCTDVEVTVATRHATARQTVLAVRPEQKVVVTIPITALGWPDLHGWSALEVCIDGDTLRVDLEFPPPSQSIVLNELMFDPRPGSADYVEVVNMSADSIEMSGWTMRDASSLATIPTSTSIGPGAYLVLASKASVAELMRVDTPVVLSRAINYNTTGDRVAVYTSSGFLVDEMTYASGWHQEVLSSTRGIALEKLAPGLPSGVASSWTSCADSLGGTPGLPNSTTRSIPPTTSLMASPSPFSSDPRDTRYPTVIAYQNPFRYSRASIQIHTLNGNHVATVLNSEGVFSQGAVIWDGTDDSGQRVQPGPYLIWMECVDALSSRTHQATAVVVVGR